MEDGNSTLVSDVLSNALSPIYSNFEGHVTFSKFEQFLKAPFPIASTSSGIGILLRALLSANADLAITVTNLSFSVSFSINFFSIIGEVLFGELLSKTATFSSFPYAYVMTSFVTASFTSRYPLPPPNILQNFQPLLV